MSLKERSNGSQGNSTGDSNETEERKKKESVDSEANAHFPVPVEEDVD